MALEANHLVSGGFWQRTEGKFVGIDDVNVIPRDCYRVSIRRYARIGVTLAPGTLTHRIYLRCYADLEALGHRHLRASNLKLWIGSEVHYEVLCFNDGCIRK